MEANFLDKLGSSDFESWVLVQRSYRMVAWGEPIMECGFNTNSGYVYIALENGITIASNFGQNVEYIVYNHETEDEEFYSTYNKAYENL